MLVGYDAEKNKRWADEHIFQRTGRGRVETDDAFDDRKLLYGK